MPSIELLVNNAIGLHARPAVLLVNTAQKFESEIKIKIGDKEGNAKSLLSILGLGIAKGTNIIAEANGPDASQALKAIQELASNNFGEK
jgi:phosphocarrier protein HPr